MFFLRTHNNLVPLNKHDINNFQRFFSDLYNMQGLEGSGATNLSMTQVRIY